jgi:benzoate membrane transport protein
MSRELKQDFSVSAMVAGIIAVVVSYGGPAAIIFQAASVANLDKGQLTSWIWAVSIGSGVAGIYLSFRLKTPVITAWSTPGAALLVAGWSAYSYSEAIGCFMFSGAIITLFGITGLFSAVMDRIPKAIVAAMLAGILLRFGLDVFGYLEAMPMLVAPMILCFLITKRLSPRYAILVTLMVGFLVAYYQGMLTFGQIEVSLATPQFTPPQFTLRSIISLGIPLCLVTLAGQYATGLGVIRAAGYSAPANPMITTTGVISILMAPFGAHGINLAAITAAICTGSESHPDPRKRYVAGIACALSYLLVGSFGATLVGLFMALPKQLIAVIAGLALFGAIIAGLSQAMAEEGQREGALMTLLVTVSGLSFFGIGSAFWGLIGGLFVSQILTGKLAADNFVKKEVAPAD